MFGRKVSVKSAILMVILFFSVFLNFAKKIKKAIDIAELSDVVKRLENGLDTKIGKGGVNLSGGERQRVSIARMIVKDPNIVILDESTSALDSLTEDKLFTKLKEYLKDKTTIIIAHRLSTIKDASRVFELKEGILNEPSENIHSLSEGSIK